MKLLFLYITLSISSLALSQDISDYINQPNVFTPNGDSINDVFSFTTTNVTQLQCTVFNRWGEIVGTFYGINGYWDGHLPSGEKANEGVYFYTVTFIDGDARTYTFNGNVHLLR